MSLISTAIKVIKRLWYGSRGEPYHINGRKLYFQEGSRPTRRKYLNSDNWVNRNEILQYDYIQDNLKKDSVFWDIGCLLYTSPSPRDS